MAIQCRHCGGGRAYLMALTEDLENGVRLQVVRCLRCGWQVDRLVQVQPVAPLPKPAPVASNNPAGRGVLVVVPCAIPGCSRKHSGQARHPLCNDHRMKLASWLRGKRLTAPPVMQVNGVWIERDAPLPGIPGERQTITTPAAPPSTAKRQTQNNSPIPKVRGNHAQILAQLQTLAARGNDNARRILAHAEGDRL